jgi:hypothetical protein
MRCITPAEAIPEGQTASQWLVEHGALTVEQAADLRALLATVEHVPSVSEHDTLRTPTPARLSSGLPEIPLRLNGDLSVSWPLRQSRRPCRGT